MKEAEIEQLLDAAQICCSNAIPGNSDFPVGAAVLGDDGKIYTGVNWELITYQSECAERNALGSAFAAGNRKVRAVALFAPSANLTTPCGTCRQAIAQFAIPDAPIICSNGKTTKIFTPADLLPYAFVSIER